MPVNQKKLSRRDFMKLVGAASAGAALASQLPPFAWAQEGYGGPLGIEQAVIEMQIRESGSQRAPAYEKVVERLAELYPETEYNMVYDQGNWTALRPRFLAGDPPDGTWLSVEGDPWGLLDEDLLMDLTPLMEAPAFGNEDVMYKDTFLPGLLTPGQKDGVQYLIPHSPTTWGLWYNKALFDEMGWEVPEELGAWTWDDFTALSEEIKSAGMMTILSGGPGNAGAFWWAFFMNFWYQIGGDEQLNAMDSLTPGAWSNEVIVAALTRANELFADEHIDPLWSSIDWGDAATLNLQNRVAFYPDGNWHVAQYADAAPEGFEMAFAPIPVVPEVEGSPKLLQAAAEPCLMVPVEAQNPRGAMEFYRLWNSEEFRLVFAELAGDMSPLIYDVSEADVHPAVASMLSYFTQGERFYNPMYNSWYAQLREEANAGFTEMVLGNATPEETAALFEEAAQAVRDDDSVTKHQRG